MKVLTRRFNIYLALAVLLGLACGCQTGKKKTQTAVLRVHIEVNPGPGGSSQQITLLRSTPVLVTIANTPILSEANIINAKLIEAQGGFAIAIKFDGNGTWFLEQYSASNPGRHFVIWGLWNENDFTPFSAGDIVSPPSLASKLKQPADAVSLHLKSQLSATTLAILASYQGTNSNPIPLQIALAEDFNRVIRGPLIYDAKRFAGVVLRSKTQQFLAQNPEGPSLQRLNRLLLEDAYPLDFFQNHTKAFEGRWLAAPFISHRISNGELVFTPDCEREEANQLVLGLTEASKQIRKNMLK